jgi:hypothetical protein
VDREALLVLQVREAAGQLLALGNEPDDAGIDLVNFPPDGFHGHR